MFKFVLHNFFLGRYAWALIMQDRGQFWGVAMLCLMSDVPLAEGQDKSILLGYA